MCLLVKFILFFYSLFSTAKAAKYIATYFKNIGIPPPNKLPKEIQEIKNFLSKTLSLEKKEIKRNNNIEKYYQKFTVKTRKHNCKLNCSDCEVDFITKLIGSNRWIKGENILGYMLIHL